MADAGDQLRTGQRRCRKCGCTNVNACIRVGLIPEGPIVEPLPDEAVCSWVDYDLCSACLPKAEGWVHPRDREGAQS